MSSVPVVIKVGGALIGDSSATKALFQHIKDLQAERPVVLVHGGGPMVEQLMQDLGLKSEKIDGLRVTPDEHMTYICGALAGTANKTLSASALVQGLLPVGLSLIDGDMVECQELDPKYGAVGVPSPGKADLLESLLDNQCLPIVSSIGSSAQGRLLNINADQAATVIALLLGADLLLLSNVLGVLDATKSLVPQLNEESINTLKSEGVITDGMAVKVDAALEAASTITRPVAIASWSAPLTDILSGVTGTRVTPSL